MTAEPTPSHPGTLLAEARRLSGIGHPWATEAWERCAAAVERTGDVPPDGERAELLDHRAMALARTEPAAGAALFAEAAALFDRAGLPGDAVACRARAALATAFAGDARAGLEQTEALCAEVTSLHAGGRATTRHATAVFLSRARVRAGLLAQATDRQRAAARLDAELADLIAFADPHRDEPAVRARIAEATETRGRLAARAGDTAAATRLLTEAVRLFRDAGRPWQATEAELSLARGLLGSGRAAQSEELLAAVLADPRRAEALTDRNAARLRLALADSLAAQQRHERAAGLRAEAAGYGDAVEPGRGTRLGAYARLQLAGSQLELGRHEEAAAVLSQALPGLLAEGSPDEVLRARSWLGHALSRTGRHGDAAGQFLRAADLAAETPACAPYDEAVLAQLAAEALREANRTDEAVPLYDRAQHLWEAQGDAGGTAGVLRSRALLALAMGDEDLAVDLTDRARRYAETGRHVVTAEEQRNPL